MKKNSILCRVFWVTVSVFVGLVLCLLLILWLRNKDVEKTYVAPVAPSSQVERIFKETATTDQFSGQSFFRAQDATLKHLRETVLNPSVVSLNMRVFVSFSSGKNSMAAQCGVGIGGAFVVSKEGFFVTNRHVVTMSEEVIKECEKKATEYILKEKLDVKKENIKIFSDYRVIFSNGEIFPVLVKKVWKDKDIAVLKVKDNRHTFTPVVFSNASSFSDEAVAAIGSPLDFPNSIIVGKILSPLIIKNGGEKFILANIQIEGGNSGGVAVTLSDMKVAGMVTVAFLQKNSQIPAPYAGIIPASVILEALEEAHIE